MVILNNIDTIYEEFQTKLTKCEIIRKVDGITLECKMKSKRTKFDTVKTEIEKLCEEYNLLPISLEQNEEDKTLFVLQFPELNVIYTDTEKENLYKNTFKWLLDNAIEKTKMNISGLPTNITKQLLQQSKDVYVKLAVTIFCNNGINPYKQTKETYLKDTDYLKSVGNIYMNYLDTYCFERGIK